LLWYDSGRPFDGVLEAADTFVGDAEDREKGDSEGISPAVFMRCI
jgi:hypothetical protein